MLPAESTALQAALTRIGTSFPSTSAAALYIRCWINDCKANGQGSTEQTANIAPAGLVATTVALLPTAVGVLNDEYIVTDSTVATNGGTVAGTGATRVLVRSNNTNWLIV